MLSVPKHSLAWTCRKLIWKCSWSAGTTLQATNRTLYGSQSVQGHSAGSDFWLKSHTGRKLITRHFLAVVGHLADRVLLTTLTTSDCDRRPLRNRSLQDQILWCLVFSCSLSQCNRVLFYPPLMSTWSSGQRLEIYPAIIK